MKQVTATDALRDLSRFLREVYCWEAIIPDGWDGCKEDEAIGISRHTVKAMRRVVDSALDSLQNGTPIRVPDKHSGVYEQLIAQLGRSGNGRA